jgi:hypothetical protein
MPSDAVESCVARNQRRRDVARPVIGRVGVGDVLGQNALGVPDATACGAQHRKDRDIGDRHWVRPSLEFHWADFADAAMVNGWLKRLSAGFAINPPFTMRMLRLSALGTKSAIDL